MMKTMWLCFLVLGTVLMFPSQGTALPILTFEGFAPAGGGVNVNPAVPYVESGFRLTPSNSLSAVFDSAAAVDFPGNSNSDFFGFIQGNIITLTGPSPFQLVSVLLGPSSLAGSPASITLVGNLFGGGSLNTTFANLTTATPALLDWSNLSSVEFRTTADAAIDNVNLNVVAVGEPMSLLLLSSGIAGVVARSRRRRQQVQ